MKKYNWLSLIALFISLATLIIVVVDYKAVNSISPELLITILAVLVTVLITWQIYNIINVKERFKELNIEFNNKIDDFNTVFKERVADIDKLKNDIYQQVIYTSTLITSTRIADVFIYEKSIYQNYSNLAFKILYKSLQSLQETSSQEAEREFFKVANRLFNEQFRFLDKQMVIMFRDELEKISDSFEYKKDIQQLIDSINEKLAASACKQLF